MVAWLEEFKEVSTFEIAWSGFGFWSFGIWTKFWEEMALWLISTVYIHGWV